MGGDEREDRKAGLPPDLPASRGVAAITLAPDVRALPSDLDGRPAVEGRTGSLLVIAGLAADIGTHAVITEELRIGRGAEGLVLRDGRVSRFHARVFREAGRWFVEDLGSTNGTALNGRTIERTTPLGDGDKIHAGSTVLRFAVVDEAEAAFFARMDRLASTDPLTGLPAKHRFDSMLEEELRAARLGGTDLAVLMMDLDGLKAINDEHGHAIGDKVLQAVGEHLVGSVRMEDVAARLGGDEFGLVVMEADATRVEDLLARVTDAVNAALPDLHVTLSSGTALVPADGNDATVVTGLADERLYASKRA
jgi:diguanylate cyclase (GGDEF)-like protein